jgi:hypothetical protein
MRGCNMIKYLTAVLQALGKRFQNVEWVAERLGSVTIIVAGQQVAAQIVGHMVKDGTKHQVIEYNGTKYVEIDGKYHKVG